MLDGGDPKLRAVKLLSSLKDAAWTQAQSVLDPVDLHSNDGMLIFKSFIRTTFGKYEILDQTEILDEFLDKCRRRGDEQHRGYANRFKALLQRLKRIDVSIPDALAAYMYWRRGAKLTELQRQQVLTSCFNRFKLDDMIEAVCIQYPVVTAQQGHGTHGHGAHAAFDTDSSDLSQDSGDEGFEMPAEISTNIHSANYAYQNAKTKLREARSARGFFKVKKKALKDKDRSNPVNVAAPDFAESTHPKVLQMKKSHLAIRVANSIIGNMIEIAPTSNRTCRRGLPIGVALALISRVRQQLRRRGLHRRRRLRRRPRSNFSLVLHQPPTVSRLSCRVARPLRRLTGLATMRNTRDSFQFVWRLSG